MAAGDVVFCEGFEGDAQSYVFETLDLLRDEDFARSGDFGIGWTGIGTKAAQSPTFAQTAELITGFAFKWTDISNGTMGICSLVSPQAPEGVRLGIDSQRLLYIKTPDGGGSYITRAVSEFALDLNAWYFIEIYATAHASNGMVTVQVNGGAGEQGTTGAEVITLTGIRTLHPNAVFATYNQVFWGVGMGLEAPPSEQHAAAFDDVYIRKGDHFIGDSKTIALLLEDDRAVDFTRSSGTKNFDMVDEIDPDEDGTYNHTDADGEDIFEVADADFFGQVVAVQLVARARKTETQVWTLETLVQLDAETDYSPVRYIPFPDYETLPPAVFNQAPGALPWTIARINAMGVGYRALTP